MFLGLVGGAGYGAMIALATWVDPKPREIVVNVSPDKFYKTVDPRNLVRD
jgi:hypothetical protein